MKFPWAHKSSHKQRTSSWKKGFRKIINWIDRLGNRTSTLSTMTPKQKKSSKPKAGEADQNWMSSDRIFTSKSKLPDQDLHKALSRPEAWDMLSEKEKAELRKQLPESVLTDGAPNEEFLKYSSDWREGVRVVQDEVRSGRHEPEWLEEANQASKERAAGLFDKHKDKEYEEFWGQKQKVDPRAQAGEAVQVLLADMIKAGLFKTGDAFKYSRSFGRGKNAVLVEKECLLLEINGEALKFHVPAGQRKFATDSRMSPPRPDTMTATTQVATAPEESEKDKPVDPETRNTESQGERTTPDISRSIRFKRGNYWSGIAIPDEDEHQADRSKVHFPLTMTFTAFADLERQILATDGRAPPGARIDPWRHIRVVRRNQDLGALWDMREQEFNRSQRRL
ncbi:hypothetical protein MMC26_004866 [Xylographa opegraphella]|nr:hypothetical protein [Xylographa opegraphella]